MMVSPLQAQQTMKRILQLLGTISTTTYYSAIRLRSEAELFHSGSIQVSIRKLAMCIFRATTGRTILQERWPVIQYSSNSPIMLTTGTLFPSTWLTRNRLGKKVNYRLTTTPHLQRAGRTRKLSCMIRLAKNIRCSTRVCQTNSTIITIPKTVG